MGLRSVVIAGLLVSSSVPALGLEAKTVAGAWKKPAGSCEPAFFKAGERTKTGRGEPAISTVVTNAGMEIAGQLILEGARRGQLISPTTDKAIFLIDDQPGGKLRVMAIGEPVLSWPTVILDACPGTRPATP